MAHSASSITSLPVQYTISTRVFGCTHSPSVEKKFYASCKDLNSPVEKLFLNETAATTALERANIPKAVRSFVSFSSDPTHMKRWEHAANTKLTSVDGVPAVEADFQSLTRDLGACIAIPQLYGQDFLDRNPTLLSDFWTFDNELFPLAIIGVPRWAPIKPVRDGIAAQSRLHLALQEFYHRVAQLEANQPIDFNANLSDISPIPLSRIKTYVAHDWTPKERGQIELGLLWGQNANTQPVLFWLLTYVYSTPGLLPRVRQEITPYLTLDGKGELTALDIASLSRSCPLLKACIYETYRLVNEANSIRYLTSPVPLSSSSSSTTTTLPSHTFISALMSLPDHDPTVYTSPETFVPERFLETSADGKLVARYGKLRPWGVGAGMCKGRTFAEKEILAVGAAVMGMWDVGPVGGKWELPERIPGTGVQKPVRDVRVVITRRGV